MLKPLMVWIRNNFGFSRTETNGFVILIPLMLFFLLAPTIYTAVFSKSYKNHSSDQVLLDSLLKAWNENVKLKKEKKNVYRLKPDLIVTLQKFDPNVANKQLLTEVGIPSFLAQRILNYREKGGVFKIKKDLGKIYDFPDSIYQILKPYVQLPEKISVKKKRKKPNPELIRAELPKKKAPIKELIVIDINLADSTGYKSLRGIGPVYAKRILKYRSLLGGFVSIEQLTEVYGVTDSLILSLEGQLVIREAVELRKVKINLASFKQLLSHPYISYEQAGNILNTKSKYGKFKSKSDLKNLNLFSTKELEKLIPYLVY